MFQGHQLLWRWLTAVTGCYSKLYNQSFVSFLWCQNVSKQVFGSEKNIVFRGSFTIKLWITAVITSFLLVGAQFKFFCRESAKTWKRLYCLSLLLYNQCRLTAVVTGGAVVVGWGWGGAHCQLFMCLALGSNSGLSLWLSLFVVVSHCASLQYGPTVSVWATANSVSSPPLHLRKAHQKGQKDTRYLWISLIPKWISHSSCVTPAPQVLLFCTSQRSTSRSG